MKWRNMLGVNGGKLLTLICAAVVAGCAFADRTANREWVGRNFAPSNLVPRVEALENAEPPVEADPVFGAWKEDAFNTDVGGVVDPKLSALDANLRRDLALPPKWATGNLTNANGVGLVDLKDKATTIDAGERWTPSAMRESYWYALAYGNGVFVAANYDGRGLWYSSDGINWTQSNKWSDNWYALAYGNGRFIANGGASGYVGIWYSDNGKDWVQSSLTKGQWQTLAFGNGRFVAGKVSSLDGTSIQYSDDGINWTASAMPTGYSFGGLAYGNGRFIAGGYALGSSGGSYGIFYSDDGNEWTRSSIRSGKWRSLAYGNGVFVAGSSENSGIWYSIDGATWTQSEETSGGLCGLDYVNGRFLAGKNDNTGILCSFDGISWTQGEKTSGYWKGFAFGNGRVVGLGSSTDGIWYSDPVEIKTVPFVQRIRVNGIELTADEDNVVDIPIATLKSALGIE